MKLQKVTDQMRRDFWGTYECEFCNHIEKNVSGYDDYNFHANVTPKMKCKSCGESTLSKGGDVQQVQTEISDKEIFYQKQVMNPYSPTKHLYTAWEKGFMDCAEWYREQLKTK